MYLALYRRFRPDNFEQVVGQEHIVKTLKNQILNDQLNHAYLFCGSRGTGKTSVAKIFARAVNCMNSVNGSPCGQCEVCKNLAQTNNIDVIEIDAASNNRVDEIRDLRDKVKYPPIYGKYKVYIIDEVHMLTDSAFNALLKTLEEPPKHIIFILATTEPQKLPATILSRVLRFDFKLVGRDDLCKLLDNIFNQSNIKAENEAISEIARAGNGSVRDTLSIADMCASYANNNIKYQDVLDVLGTSNQELLLTLLKSILNSDINTFVTTFNSEIKNGKNIVNLSGDITRIFRDLLVIKAGGVNPNVVDLSLDMQQQLFELSKKYDMARINRCFQAFSGIEADLKYATSPQLLIEATAIGLADMSIQKNDNLCDVDVNMRSCDSGTTNIAQNISNINSNVEKQKIIEPIEEVYNQENVKEADNINPHKIWGQVLTELNDINIMLHAACADVSNVSVRDDVFIINIECDSIIDMIKKSENYTDLVACFSKLGYNYKIEIVKGNSERECVDKTKILSEKLGLSVQIKK